MTADDAPGAAPSGRPAPDDGIFPPGAASPPPESSQWGKSTASDEEEVFLQGPHQRRFEALRAVKIFIEFIRGFRGLHFVGPCVTVFGSARFPEDHHYYKAARAMGAQLGRAGFTVMTGGGPGIMEAANRGARDVGAPSVGCNIKLPSEQAPNPYLDHWLDFDYFFVRKVMLVKYSYAFVAFPGGYGTLDEIFETVTLVQTGKIKDFPIVLMGVEFWTPLITFVKGTLLREGTISPEDPARMLLTDSPEEAVEHILAVVMRDFGLTQGRRSRRNKLLLELER